MVEARRKVAAVKKGPPPMKGKKKGGKKGMSEAEADALFESELQAAILMSRQQAGLEV
jgi:hypothetical protein